MAADYKTEDNILEVLDCLKEVYVTFNEVLKGGNVIYKVQAVNSMRAMKRQLEERLENYSQTFANLNKDDHELLEKKAEEFKVVGEKVKLVEEVMEKTDKLMDKYYPVKTKMAIKKRARLKSFQTKKIRD